MLNEKQNRLCHCLKKDNINYEYLLHELVNKIQASRVLYINLHVLLHTSTDTNAIDQQVFLTVIQENSNKAYPSMVAHHQVALQYSIISQRIIYSFETDTF